MFSRKLFYVSLVVIAALAFAAAGTLAALTFAPTNASAGGGPNSGQLVSAVVQPSGGSVNGGITVVGVGTAAGHQTWRTCRLALRLRLHPCSKRSMTIGARCRLCWTR